MTLLPIILPQDVVLKVSVGDNVSTGDVIAEVKSDSPFEVLLLSKDYEVSPKNIKNHLKKNLGDKISEGDTIAEIKGNFGMTSQNIVSNFSGIVAKIDEEKGEVSIKKSDVPDAVSIFSPVDGIVEICNNDKIVIKTNQQAVLVKDSVGKEGRGKLKFIQNFDSEKLTAGIDEKIAVVKKIDKASLFKIIGLGGAGVIIEDLEGMDFIDLNDKKIKIPVMIVSNNDFEKIEKKDGESAYLNGENKCIIIL